MTRTEFAMGSVIFIAVIAAGALSAHTVDRHFAKVEAAEAEAKAAKNLAANDKVETPEPPSVRGACVDADGSWKNWPWANVPMLSPKCE
jgi:hypothetical protein